MLFRPSTFAGTALALLFAMPIALADCIIDAPTEAEAAPAFPGALGFGAKTKGGRGGAVHQVTNLNDSGPGSLRACVQASGPRTCVFATGGTITLKSSLSIRNPYLTIAGQTAPGGGIQLRMGDNPPNGHAYPITINGTHDIIIRHIRSRPGRPAGIKINLNDAIVVINSRNLILDHVSLAWATDENLNFHANVTDATVQWSILAEGLWDHSKGSLTCSTTTDCRNITFHHNLYHSNRDRNPDLNGTRNGPIEVVNNVVSNQYSEGTEVWANSTGTRANVVGNSYLLGSQTNRSGPAIVIQTSGNAVYQADNLSETSPLTRGYGFVSAPPYPLSIVPEPRAAAMEKVWALAGAWPRDAADARFVDQSKARKGTTRITNPSGYPTLASGTAPTDTDKDGMPDDFERRLGFNPGDPADRNGDHDGDGYTNLEEHLNERAEAVLVGG